MTLRYDDLILGPDDHTGRPAVTVAAEGALFVCTEDDVIERNDGSTWVEWFDPEEDQ